MKRKRTPEENQIDDAQAQASIARARAGELLGPSDLQAIFKLRRARFHELNQIHAFDQFRVHPPIGTKCFSGTLVARYLDGEPVYADVRRRRG